MEALIKEKLIALANNIRSIRLIRNYSQEYLALKLKISQNAYSKIELGYTKVTVERLFGIAHILEVGLMDLFEQPKHADRISPQRYSFGA
jgi:transcriptional regulator with XRE-family HTH domain